MSMWRQTAKRFKNNHTVVGYDLMCEPNSNEVLFDNYDEPEKFYPSHAGKLEDWNQLYPKIIAGIRAEDPKTPVLVSAMGYGAVNWLPYLKTNSDKYIVYTVHDYAPVGYTHQSSDSPVSYPGSVGGTPIDTTLANNKTTLSKFKSKNGVTVASNELGLNRWTPNGQLFSQKQMGIFEGLGMNYAVWMWFPSFVIKDDDQGFNFRLGPNPNSTKDVSSSKLMDAMKKYWGKNTLRPSKVKFQ